ncbi:ROK family protein [Mycoplasmopsis cynos]|nr:ROK family protein [Mycoplasmopsis cynos]
MGGAWKNFDVKQYLLKNTQIKDIVFENDANVILLINHVYYKKNLNDVSQFYTISTGFGSGLIINNKIFHGNNYYRPRNRANSCL